MCTTFHFDPDNSYLYFTNKRQTHGDARGKQGDLLSA